jgi:hypothetical protein
MTYAKREYRGAPAIVWLGALDIEELLEHSNVSADSIVIADDGGSTLACRNCAHEGVPAFMRRGQLRFRQKLCCPPQRQS